MAWFKRHKNPEDSTPAVDNNIVEPDTAAQQATLDAARDGEYLNAEEMKEKMEKLKSPMETSAEQSPDQAEAEPLPENNDTPENSPTTEAEAEPALTEEEIINEATKQLLEDSKWLHDYIASEFPELSEEEQQEIVDKYISIPGKLGFKDSITKAVKDAAQSLEAGGIKGILAKAGVGAAVGALKMATRSLILGSSFGSAVAIGAAAGGITGMVQTHMRERRKVNLDNVYDQLNEAEKNNDALRVSQIIGNLERQLLAGKMWEKDAKHVRYLVLETKVKLEVLLRKAEFENQSTKDKIDLILKASSEARGDLNRKQNKEVAKLLKEIKFKTDKNSFLNYKAKLAKAFVTGAVVGAFGASIGAGITQAVHYVADLAYSGRGLNKISEIYGGTKPAAPDAIKDASIDQIKEQLQQRNERMIAGATESAEKMRDELASKSMEVAAKPGDGAVNMYRSAIHDYLVNEGKLNGKGLDSYSVAERNYAEEYLNKMHALELANGDTHLDPNDIAKVKVVDIQDALKHASDLSDSKEAHLDALLKTKGHLLSTETISEMNRDDLINPDNNFSNITLSPDAIQPDSPSSTEIIPDSSTPSDVYQPDQSGPVAEQPTSENPQPKPQKKGDWIDFLFRNPEKVAGVATAVVGGGALLGAGIVGGSIWAGLRWRDRKSFDRLTQHSNPEGFEIIPPESQADKDKIHKQRGSLYRALAHYIRKANEEGVRLKKVVFDTDPHSESHEDDHGVLHLNIYEKSKELKLFLEDVIRREKYETEELSDEPEVNEEEQVAPQQSVEEAAGQPEPSEPEPPIAQSKVTYPIDRDNEPEAENLSVEPVAPAPSVESDSEIPSPQPPIDEDISYRPAPEPTPEEMFGAPVKETEESGEASEPVVDLSNQEDEPEPPVASTEPEIPSSQPELEDNNPYEPVPQPSFEDVFGAPPEIAEETEEAEEKVKPKTWSEHKRELFAEGKRLGVPVDGLDSWSQVMRTDKGNFIDALLQKEKLSSLQTPEGAEKDYIQKVIMEVLNKAKGNMELLAGLYTDLLNELPADSKAANKSNIKKLIGHISSILREPDHIEALSRAIPKSDKKNMVSLARGGRSIKIK